MFSGYWSTPSTATASRASPIVVCNNGDDPEIEKGGTFTCEVIVDGRKRQVLAVFQDDNGTYEVDRPR